MFLKVNGKKKKKKKKKIAIFRFFTVLTYFWSYFLFDMERGDQNLYVSTKYSIIWSFIIENLWGCNNPLGKICYKKKKKKKKQPRVIEKDKPIQLSSTLRRNIWPFLSEIS